MLKNPLIVKVFTALLVPMSLIITLLVLEGLSAGLYYTGYYPIKATDQTAFFGRFPASLRLSPLDIALLQGPMDQIDPGALVLMKAAERRSELVITLLASVEFYEGAKIQRVSTRSSEGVVNKLHLKGRDVQVHEDPNDLFRTLKTRISSTNRKLLITTGGSTTAWSYNWPFPLAQMIERDFPGQYIVLNMGQPGFVSWKTGHLLEKHIFPLLDQLDIQPTGLLALDGTNDTVLSTIYFLDSLIRQTDRNPSRPLGRTCEDDYIGTNACEALEEDLVAQESDLTSQTVNTASKDPYFQKLNAAKDFVYLAMPYTSTFAWRAKDHFVKGGRPPESMQITRAYDSLTVRETTSDIKSVSLNEGAGAITQQFFMEGIEKIISITKKRGITLNYFLQPILEKKYYKNLALRWNYWKYDEGAPIYFRPDLSYYLYKNPMYAKRADFLVDHTPQYERNERLFSDLAKNHGCCFHNIADALFDSDPRINGAYVLTKDDYSSDAIHYTADGPRKIAARIFHLWKSSNEFTPD